MNLNLKLVARFLSLGYSRNNLPLLISHNGLMTVGEFVEEVSEKEYVILYPSHNLIPGTKYKTAKDVYFVPFSSHSNIFSSFRQRKKDTLIDFRTFNKNLATNSFLSEVLWNIFQSWGIEDNKAAILDVFMESILKDEFVINVFEKKTETVLSSKGDVYIIINPERTSKKKVMSQFDIVLDVNGKDVYEKKST